MHIAQRPSRPEQRRSSRRWFLGLGAGAGLVALVVSRADLGVLPETPALQQSAGLAEIRSLLEGPATISVLGDSTGNGGDEWVALWAQHLGDGRRVVLHQWLNNSYTAAEQTYGGTGEELQVWNAGQPGGSADWAVPQLSAVQPRQPDLVIINAGHNDTAKNLSRRLDRLNSAIRSRWGPTLLLLILQNPGRGVHERRQEATRRAASAWAQARQVPAIDIAPAFDDLDRLLRDDVHPNELGSRAWADAVAAALT